MNRVRKKYVDGPYGQIHVRCGGTSGSSRPPLLCFHATPFSGRSYEPLMREIGRDRPVYAFDTPGYGESDRPDTPLSIQQYAAALLVGIDALGLGPQYDLIGTHTGSRIAVEVALGRPALARRLVLVGCAVYTESERQSQQHTSFDLEIPRADDTGLAPIIRIWEYFDRYRRIGTTDALIERHVSDLLRDREYASWGHVAVYKHDLASRLPQVDQPTLLVNADDDLAQPTPRALDLLPRSRLVDLSPAGFGVLESHPAQCAEVIREFLDAEPTEAGTA